MFHKDRELKNLNVQQTLVVGAFHVGAVLIMIINKFIFCLYFHWTAFLMIDIFEDGYSRGSSYIAAENFKELPVVISEISILLSKLPMVLHTLSSVVQY